MFVCCLVFAVGRNATKPSYVKERVSASRHSLVYPVLWELRKNSHQTGRYLREYVRKDVTG